MKPLLFIILSLLIVGCSHEQSHNDTLTQAEQMVFTQPDSVIRMLTPCWNDSTMSDAEQALFGLLYTEALHRSGLSTMSDSLIRISRMYYEQQGDDEHLSRVLLHHAIILYKQQETHEAVLTMKRAEQLAHDVDLPAYKWFLYAILGDINDNVGNYYQTLRYYKQALLCARECDNAQWTVQMLNNIAMTFDMLGENDSLKYYTDLAKPYAEQTSGDVRATYLVNQASYLVRTNKRNEAKRCLIEARQVAPTERGDKLLADICLQDGDSAAAAQLWYQLANSLSPDVSIQSYRLLIDYLNRRDDVENVAEYSQRLNQVYQSLYERRDAAGIIDMQVQFDEQTRERSQYRTTIALLTVVILLILIAGVIIRYSHVIHRELTRMRHQKEREARENSRELKDVVSRLHAAADRGKAASDDDINTLAQLSYAQNPALRERLSVLNAKEQTVCLLTRQNFLPTEIAVLTISTPQTITNIRGRLLKKLFGETGGAKEFDAIIRKV